MVPVKGVSVGKAWEVEVYITSFRVSAHRAFNASGIFGVLEAVLGTVFPNLVIDAGVFADFVNCCSRPREHLLNLSVSQL